MFENFNFGKTGFKTCVLEKHLILYSFILFLIFNALRSFFKNRFIFSKNYVFPEFRLIKPVFRSIEIVLKNNGESLSISINRNWFSINQKSWVRFLKNHIWLVQITFSKLFQTPFSLSDSDKHNPHFFVVFDQILCKVFLSQGQYVHYTLSFSFIFSFSCIEGLFLNLAYFEVFDDSNLILWNWSLGFCSRIL